MMPIPASAQIDPAHQDRALGADYLVEGTVRRQDQRLRIAATLVRTRDHVQMWSEVYDRSPADLATLDRQLAATIASEAGFAVRAATRSTTDTLVEHGVSARAQNGAGDRPRTRSVRQAQAFGLEKELGTVEAGKRAHLLLLRANPLVSVEAYDAVETVIHAGRPIERQGLSARRRR